MTYKSVRDAALAAYAAGINVIPPKQDGSKAPDCFGWKAEQRKRQTQRQVELYYSVPRTGVGWITGSISAPPGFSLEVIDFDDRSTYAQWRDRVSDAGLLPILERIEQGYCEHSPNGAHLVYRTDASEGNLKLAQVSTEDGAGKKTTIETRGEGGYIIVAPSYGGINKSGEYILVSGGVDTIATITSEEREELFLIARTFDKMPRAEEVKRAAAIGESGRPGDEYNERATWPEILEPHGWVPVYQQQSKTTWRRPGKKAGISATTGHAGSDYLYVFSSNAAPFDSGRGYSKFSAYALLNHAGNFAAAAEDLALLGYGRDKDYSDIDTSGILASAPEHYQPISKPGFPEHLLDCPGLIGEFCDYINGTSARQQRILSLAASIAAVGVLIGRKVRTKSDLRSNVYVIGVGQTGCGKDHARKAISKVFEAVGADDLIRKREPASDAAITTALTESQSLLFLIDEFGRYVQAIGSAKGHATHLVNQTKVFLEAFSSANGTIEAKGVKDGGKVSINQPCLCIYGTSTPGVLFDQLQPSQIDDGLLTRFLIFETDEPEPPLRIVEFVAPPTALLEDVRAWLNYPAVGNLAMVNPSPAVVRMTSDAERCFDALNSDLVKRRADMRKADIHGVGVYTRTWELAAKLAMIRACGIRHTQPEITELDASWGCQLALYLSESLIARILTTAGNTAFERRTKRILLAIETHGPEGVSRSKLQRRIPYQTMDNGVKDFDDAIKHLVGSGLVHESKETRRGPGRPSVVYVSAQYLRGNDGARQQSN